MRSLILLIIVLILCSSDYIFSQSNNWKVFTKENSDLPSNFINAIEIDSVNNIWIGTGNGLAKYNGCDWTVFNTANSELPDNCIQALAVDNQNNLWIGTFNGLARLSNNDWQVFDTSNSPLPSNDVISLGVDDNNHLWVGTFPYFGSEDVGGVAKFDGSNWIVYTTNNSDLPNNMVTAFAFDNLNNIWMAIGNRYILGQGGGVVKFDGSNWESISIANLGLPWDFVFDIAIDDSQNIWFGTMAGLAIFNGKNWVTYNTQNSALPHSSIPCLAIENNKAIWIGTDGLYENGGLVRLYDNEMTIFNKSNSQLPWNRIWALKINNKNGDKFIGTYGTARSGGGFAIYNENGVRTNIGNITLSDPVMCKLNPNYPNPFNSMTKISFYIPKSDFLILRIFDINGREVKLFKYGEFAPGLHYINFYTEKLSSGVYFYQLITSSYIETRKMLLIR